MSSTTRPLGPSTIPQSSGRRDRSHREDRQRGQRGQILVLFVGGLVAFLAIAALVFDVGQNLFDWRTQRNAADAAALAGSRYIAEPGCLAAPSIAACTTAYQAAIHVAALNGYGDVDGDGTDDRGHVDVHIPPIASGSSYAGLPGFLEVDIHTDRPSFFATVLGVLQQNVDALAIAGNSTEVAPPYSMLALNPGCPAGGQVTGSNANVTVLNGGTVVVNSDCDPALQVNGGASLTADECDVVGTAPDYSNGDLNCPVNNFSGAGDPLITMGPGTMPDPPANTEHLFHPSGSAFIPPGCPGSTVQIGYVNSAFAAADSVALPAFNIGDIALVYAYRSGSDTPPGPSTGWTDIDSGGGDNNSSRVGYKVLDGTETTTGTWSNATAIEVVILQGQDTDAPIGAHDWATTAGTTMSTPALTLTPTPSATSWVVAFGGATSGANAASLAIAGQTVTNRLSTVSSLSLHTGRNVTSWPQTNYGGSVVGPNRAFAVQILANPAPSTAANPVGCTLSGAGAGRYNVYRLHPGTYFGGIHLTGRRVRVYLAAGTYWLAGGGLEISGNDNQLVSESATTPLTPGRGVFIYDTEDTGYCGIAPGNPCIGAINIHGGSSNACTDPPQPVAPGWTPNPPTQACQWVHLEPTDSPIKNLLIFIDRAFTGVGVTFNGDAGKLELSGTIYDPWGQVKINGEADDTVSAQIIAYTFLISGNGNFTVTYDADGVVQLSGAGLVQ